MPAPTAAYLVAKRDDGFGDVYPLQRGVTFGVGRNPKNRIVLPDDLCSATTPNWRMPRGLVCPRSGADGRRSTARRFAAIKSSIPRRVQFGRSKFLFLYDLSQLPDFRSAGPARGSDQDH
jgi:Nif-specific regulatory protein